MFQFTKPSHFFMQQADYTATPYSSFMNAKAYQRYPTIYCNVNSL